MKNTNSFAHSFAQSVMQNPDLPHSAVRVGLWLCAIADTQGADTVELYYTDIIRGFTGRGPTPQSTVRYPGITIRPATVRAALDALVDAGLIAVQAGTGGRLGNLPTKFTLGMHH